VLSESINQARATLLQKFQLSEIVALIGRLQNAEKDKLNYTAALHFERIRTQPLLSVGQSTAGDRESSMLSMLQEDVRSLNQKISKSVEEVNDVLEELRFGLIDQED
jgi:F0F1-type ATP synthase beta subunit